MKYLLLSFSALFLLFSCSQQVQEKAMEKTTEIDEAGLLKELEEQMPDKSELQAMLRLSKEVAADTSRPNSQACEAMTERMKSLREEHASLHDILLDLNKNMRLCMMNKSDAAIGGGECSQWEEQAQSIRESQKRMYERFQAIQEELQKACR